MESGSRSARGGVPGGAAEGGGQLCHACGYQYPNAHPSAKQRRAHRKHCGKPASAAAAAEEEEGTAEREGRELLPGEGGGAGAGGDGIGASAAECGGGSPGSAPEAANAAVVDVDDTEHSHDGAGSQVSIDKCAEDHSNNASDIAPATNKTHDGGTLNEVATQYSGKASLPEECDLSVAAPAVGSEQLQDVSVPVLPPDPGHGEVFSPELSVSEIQNSKVMSLASDPTGGEVSGQTNDVVTDPNGTTVTGVYGTTDTIGKNLPSAEVSVKCGDFDSSCEENLQTKVGEGHSNTAVEEGSSDKNLGAAHNDEVPNDEPESNQESRPILTSSIVQVPNTEEPVKSGTQFPVSTDDPHSEATVGVKTQEQPGSTSVMEDHLAIPEQTDIVEGHHYPSKDGDIQTVSSALGPAVVAKDISVGDADNITKNVFSSDVTMGDGVQEDVTCNTVVPSQADLVERSIFSTTHEINTVSSTNDVEDKGQNEKFSADLATHEINEVQVTDDVEEKQLNKAIVAESSSSDTNAVCSSDNYWENEKEMIAGASSCKVPSTCSIEEKEQIEEVIVNPAPEKIKVTNYSDTVEENKQSKRDVKTSREIDVACSTEAIEEKDTTYEINAGKSTDNVEDKKQGEEISTGDISDGSSVICSTVDDGKMRNEAMTEDPSSHETIVVCSTDNVEEKKYEETMADPTSNRIGVLTDIGRFEERKDDETTADLTSHGVNEAHTTEDVEEMKNGEPMLAPTSSKISTVGSVGEVEDKKQKEETTAYPISGENNTPQSTVDADKGMQIEDASTVPAADKAAGPQNTDDVEEREQKGETAAKEISTVQSMDEPKGTDQNEEIADKEVIMDSDSRNHVSLKVLLADKNVETKEKKLSTKDRVLSFKRRSSKDSESPAKPGSPKAGSGQQDWNSPARLPVEKKSKGKKQQWMPFICCPSIH